jgi:hypothetical protein
MIPTVIVDWLEPWAHEFFIMKGLIGLLATVLIIVHMVRTWHEPLSLGRRLRYYALLLMSTLITTGSYEQIHDSASVNIRNVMGIAGAALIAVAAVVSLMEERASTEERQREQAFNR